MIHESDGAATVERRELITICRQIGSMMEAGVDILRTTAVLRAQTQNPRLLELYDAVDHDMCMGQSLADALSKAPDLFSPFVISLLRQGEADNNLASAFPKIAAYLQEEEGDEAGSEPVPAPAPLAPLEFSPELVDKLLARLRAEVGRVLVLVAVLALIEALLCTVAAAGFLKPVALVICQWYSVAIICAVGAWGWRRSLAASQQPAANAPPPEPEPWWVLDLELEPPLAAPPARPATPLRPPPPRREATFE